MQMTRMLRTPKMTATVLSASMLTIFLVGLSPLPQLLAASASNAGAAPNLSPVQLSVQTKNLTTVSSYDLVAYNSTGAAVASYTGQYPRVTLELPLGTYLFAATANGPSPTYSPVCYAKGAAGSGAASPPALPNNPGSGASSAIAYPCCCTNPMLEYGYSLTQVSGSTTVNISTQAPTAIPTSTVSVSVTYKNGSAVSDAYVSANVVGANWYWGDSSRVTMYAQTAANGVAHLVVPSVPLAVTASKSVQVDLPKGQTTTQVNIGGQLVNVTLYYGPSYVYESATALLIPPQTSLNMVVTAQTGYPMIPYGVGPIAAGQATVSSGYGAGAVAVPPNSVQAQQTSQGAPAAAGAPSAAQGNSNSSLNAALASIPPIPASDLGAPSTQPISSTPSVSLMAIGTLALAGAIAATVGIVISKKR
jgi:hypothetical protein